MAEPKPDSGKPSSQATLAAVPDPQAPRAESGPEQPARRGAPWWLFALLVVLLVLSVWGLWTQTQHARAQARELAVLSEQVVELESEVATLDGQLSAFGMQRDLVSMSVSELVAKLADLQALVAWNPLEPGGAPPAARSGAAEPAPSGPEAPAPATGEGPSASAGPGEVAGESGGADLDFDAAPGLRPGPDLELAPPAGDDLRINGL